MNININRLMESMETMWQIGATAKGGVHRLTLTEEDRAARDLFRQWCEDVGLSVRVDDLGNMYARRAGTEDLPPVMLGSHLDSVPLGGRYDGPLGVLTALEVVRTLNDHGIETKHPLEVVNWSNEEGHRFNPGLFGSSVAIGTREAEVAFTAIDDDGISYRDALMRIGYAGEIANRPADIHAYLEIHIEQGPVLEAENIPVGLVQGINGQFWREVTVIGRPGHAGANPMQGRADALVAASRMVLGLRELALRSVGYGVVTVGKMSVAPGAMNIVPARVEFTIDARAAGAEDLATFDAGIIELARDAEQAEGVAITVAGTEAYPPIPFDAEVMNTIREAMVTEGLPVRELWSGGGHDAGVVGLRWPAGMIFVRSKDGLSHAEAEYSSPEDIEAATNVLLRAAVELAR
ncbi:MAG: Zn-dependent hydrolase [Thermomicrobiales bacterium]|nr:Zn-dependent hydrolase [Thermomicrobiales bacterium]MCO5218836.1 Zn-dependent hydrolase [Thermomicrobiales bacterium]MCO5225454.1 Zn-dependent hydrolase [Thermomicrobiales bacterium]MCO5227924.1 Zn-dependent hydrolase [Thermomicrobiales bacterium]